MPIPPAVVVERANAIPPLVFTYWLASDEAYVEVAEPLTEISACAVPAKAGPFAANRYIIFFII